MKTLGDKLRNSLITSLKEQVITYLQKQFMPDYSTDRISERINSFLKTVELSIEAKFEISKYRLSIYQETDDFDERSIYWHISLIDEDDDMYAIDFIPLIELLNYPVEGYQENATLIGDVIWELTFDGWTIEEQQKRITEMEKRFEE
ncbi:MULTISPECIES: hypothetical protein [Enterococcus]|nr:MULTISPECIES: hypothetical protein [Enterococcus]MCG4307306.1 hypothetical protein [Enterococcus lactis]EME8125837.1 hypothetical protein [Enterococcus faecium]EMF0305080.1 hypothetical protein [Enterococcus faecium]MDV4861523.1 hypothetical protein [Enterococcus faecium]OTP01841.1 hypothetical protein A5856_001279 [Enterococcus faecium]